MCRWDNYKFLSIADVPAMIAIYDQSKNGGVEASMINAK
jgi:hypothetical protein